MPPSQMRGVPPITVSNAEAAPGPSAARPAVRARARLSSSETSSGTKPISTSRFAVVPAVQLGDRARRHDQQQEGEDAGLDRERAERDLLVAEHAGDAHHAAVEDRESEERERNGAGRGAWFGHGAMA